MRSKKIIIALLLILFITFSPNAIRLAKSLVEERLPWEFSLQQIALDVQGDFPIFELPDLSGIANQQFHYIGHGGQAIAFVSEDNRYVLKFFLKHCLQGKKRYPIPKPSHWLPIRQKVRQERRKKRIQAAQENLFKTMRNYQFAFEKMKEQTGLIATHLLPTKNSLPTVTIQDRNGKKHEIDLDRATFVFQRKAELVKEKLAKLATEEEKRTALVLLDQFFEDRARKGFMDTDPYFRIESNYGFVDDQPIQFDFGKVEFFESLLTSPDAAIGYMRKLLHNWAEKQLLPSF